MTDRLQILNEATLTEATATLLECCGSRRWAEEMARSRPFLNRNALLQRAEEIWANLGDADRREAFASHPQIGDVELLRERFTERDDRANAEQGQVLSATEPTLQALALGNRQYLERHGFIFIICARGRSAENMLCALKDRLRRSTAQELVTASAEQQKITEGRLRALAARSCSNTEEGTDR